MPGFAPGCVPVVAYRHSSPLGGFVPAVAIASSPPHKVMDDFNFNANIYLGTDYAGQPLALQREARRRHL